MLKSCIIGGSEDIKDRLAKVECYNCNSQNLVYSVSTHLLDIDPKFQNSQDELRSRRAIWFTFAKFPKSDDPYFIPFTYSYLTAPSATGQEVYSVYTAIKGSL